MTPSSAALSARGCGRCCVELTDGISEERYVGGGYPWNADHGDEGGGEETLAHLLVLLPVTGGVDMAGRSGKKS